MLNISYYPEDNILNDLSISNENDYYHQTEIIDDTSANTFLLNYSNNYPSLLDGTVYDTISTIINFDNIEILQDSTAVIGLPIHNTFMELTCNELCDNKYKLDNFNLVIAGYVNATQNDEAIFIHTYKNIVNDNIIYDYILNDESDFLYNNVSWDIVKKEELTGYIDESYFPDYTFKCVDSSNNIFYYKIILIDLNYTTGNVISSTFYDTTAIEYNNYNINIQHSSKNLPILLKSDKFKSILDTLRTQFKTIDILFNIKNQSASDNIKVYNDSLYFNQYMGCKFSFDISINDINNMVSNKEYYLNRGAFLKYSSDELEDFYSSEKEKIKLNVNDIKFDYVDTLFDRSLMVSQNYITPNEYYPLELYNNNTLTITLKDLIKPKSFVLDKDVKLSLMRQVSNYTTYSPSFNINNNYKISIDNFKYLYGSERTDFTSLNSNTIYIASKIFNETKINPIALNISDITSILNLMANDLNINIFYRKINKFNTILYIQYKSFDIYSYLYRQLSNSEISLIINNIILSITYYSYSTRLIETMLFEPNDTNYINEYRDNINTITYMYNIKNVDVLKINNIYNKNIVEEYYDNTDNTEEEYYLPLDVIHIANNKK